MTALISLFRGINVGGNHKIRMDELKAIHESLGLKDVVTYIQSGNVVFHSDNVDPLQLQQQIEENVEKRCGFYVEVIVRTSAELNAVIDKNPFQGQQDNEFKRLLVMFLDDLPDPAAWDALLKTYTGPEQLFIIDKEVYIYYTDGIGRSKLSNNFIEKKLKVYGTARNWNTVLQLQKLIS
jgi:uncharacterized protein (DUF1697 family)